MGNCFVKNSAPPTETQDAATHGHGHVPQASQSADTRTNSSKTQTMTDVKPIEINSGDSTEAPQIKSIHKKNRSSHHIKRKSDNNIERRHAHRSSHKHNNYKTSRSNPQTPRAKSNIHKTEKILLINPHEYDGLIPKENQNIQDINRILHTYKVIGKGGSCDVVLCRQIDQLPPVDVNNNVNNTKSPKNTENKGMNQDIHRQNKSKKSQNPLLAVKRLNRKHKRASQSIKKEISILQRLSHPNIIKLV